MQKNKSIVIKGITKQFQEKKVLSDIHLEIERGEIFGLLGPSGAGKTTLIKILTRQLKQDAGEAIVLGANVKALNDEIYKQVGMVLDNTGLYERLSCYDNLLLFAQIHGLKKSCVMEALEKTDLADAVKKPVNSLSKGMKQRLVLARAIMNHPKLLFLDEPTSGLDPMTAVRIHNLIEEQRKNGTTIFLTTHNMEEATKLCDRVALLHTGNIVECGMPKELCRKYNNQNTINILLKSGKNVVLKNEEKYAEEISDYFKENLVESIHSSEPNLETVFITLTGRGLIS